jgi:hypothetical protein
MIRSKDESGVHAGVARGPEHELAELRQARHVEFIYPVDGGCHALAAWINAQLYDSAAISVAEHLAALATVGACGVYFRTPDPRAGQNVLAWYNFTPADQDRITVVVVC